MSGSIADKSRESKVRRIMTGVLCGRSVSEGKDFGGHCRREQALTLLLISVQDEDEPNHAPQELPAAPTTMDH